MENGVAPLPHPKDDPAETSIELLHRAQDGDVRALDRLCARYLPALRRFATGRLPARARSLLETEDIVQETVVRAIKHLDRFEYRRDGALLAYLRTAVHNRIREEIRYTSRRPEAVALESNVESDPAPSALEDVIGKDTAARYEAALMTLRDVDREAIIARVELGLPYEEVASAIGKPTVTAARMAVSRALVRLAEAMSEHDG